MVQPVTTNKTSILLNPLSEPTPQRTYVTFGVERGGTSLVAGVLRALGLYLGDIPEGNNEDKSFHNKTLGQMKSTITRRNTQNDVWGWKYPSASSYLPVLSKSIRNAYFIVVYRDVVATALSRNQWDGEFIRRPMRMSLHETNAIVNANTGFALATRRPCLLVSNEKAMTKVSDLIDELADFLCFERPNDDLRSRIIAYSEPGRYKNFDEYFPATDSDESANDSHGEPHREPHNDVPRDTSNDSGGSTASSSNGTSPSNASNASNIASDTPSSTPEPGLTMEQVSGQ